MKFKRFALRGLIVLAVVVALCMFFARTVQTITTPKIQLVTGTTGKLEQAMSFHGEIYFAQTQDITVKDAAKSAITVDRVYVQPGHWVEEGETVFTAHIPTYDEDIKKLQDDYAAKASELLDLDIANRKLSKESKQNELYDTMVAAQDELGTKTYETRYAAMKAGITLSGDVTGWKKQLALLDAVPEEITTAVDETIALKGTFDAARSAFFEIYEDRKQRVSETVFKYINDRNKLVRAMEQLQEDMVALDARSASLSVVKAERSGFIAAVSVAAGDSYDGSKAAYSMSGTDALPVLKASLAGVERTIEEGTKVTIESDTYGTQKTSVEKLATIEGEKCILVTLPEDMQGQGGAVRKLISDGGIDMTITYKAKKATTLLPPSAVRNEGAGSDYVYLVQRTYGGLLESAGMKVVKTSVTVLERSDKAVSIADDLSYQQVADKEDRALTDGQTVMEYVN